MDSIPDWLSAVLLVILVSFSAFFNASETAFACMNRYKFMAEADAGKKSAKLVLKLSDSYETTLITTLTGNNVVSILMSTISTFLFFSIFQGIIPDAWVSVIASIAMAIILFLFGDTLPKFVGKSIPNTIARLHAYPLAGVIILFYPVTILFRGVSWLFHKLFRAKPDVALTEDELKAIIDDAEEQGVFEENESEIIQKTFDFADTSVKEILTPVEEMTLLNLEGLTTEQLLEYLKVCPYSRIPCYVGKTSKMAGVLVVKNYLNAYFKDPKTSYLRFVQRPYFVSTRVHLDTLLEGFKENHTQIAIVRNQGKLIGMVTMEDVLETLVGSISETNKHRRDAR